MGLIFETDAEWVSPFVIVPKKGGKLRMCIDFRDLNAATIKVKYWSPYIYDPDFRILLGQAFIFLGCHSKHYKVRESIRTSLSGRNRVSPELVNSILCDAFPIYLTQMTTLDDDGSPSQNKRELFEALLTCCALFAETFDTSKKHRLLAQLILPCHHNDICEFYTAF